MHAKHNNVVNKRKTKISITVVSTWGNIKSYCHQRLTFMITTQTREARQHNNVKLRLLKINRVYTL